MTKVKHLKLPLNFHSDCLNVKFDQKW